MRERASFYFQRSAKLWPAVGGGGTDDKWQMNYQIFGPFNRILPIAHLPTYSPDAVRRSGFFLHLQVPDMEPFISCGCHRPRNVPSAMGREKWFRKDIMILHMSLDMLYSVFLRPS